MSDSAQEKGRCHVCWEEDFLTRTKFYLPIACECCGPTHVEIVYHCFGWGYCGRWLAARYY